MVLWSACEREPRPLTWASYSLNVVKYVSKGALQASVWISYLFFCFFLHVLLVDMKLWVEQGLWHQDQAFSVLLEGGA